MFQGDETMANKAWRTCIPTLFFLFLLCSPHANAQQTLGGITGTVTDSSGAVITGATVTVVGDQTKLTRTLQTTDTGRYGHFRGRKIRGWMERAEAHHNSERTAL
jgi:hypothetical protein